MSKKVNKPTETQEAKTEEVKVEAKEVKAETTEAVTKVYCGPSVRGVVRQYTVFTGEISDLLKTFLEQHPIAEGLLVTADQFAETRKALGVKGSAQAILYDKIKKEI
jgi:hypothetical protein